MHEVLQTYLNIMYMDSIKNANLLNLNEMLRDKLIEQFKLAEEQDGKPPCTKEDLIRQNSVALSCYYIKIYDISSSFPLDYADVYCIIDVSGGYV